MMNPNVASGLPNIGNSCHMNAAIQAICSSRTLAGKFNGIHHEDSCLNFREIVNYIVQSVMRNVVPVHDILELLLERLTDYAKEGQLRTDLSDYRQDGDEVLLYLLDTKFYLSTDTKTNLKDEWDQLNSLDLPDNLLEYESEESKEFLRSLQQVFKIRTEISRSCGNCKKHLKRELATELCLAVYIPDEYNGITTLQFDDLLEPAIEYSELGTAMCDSIVVDDADKSNPRVSCAKKKTLMNEERFVGDSDLLVFRLNSPRDVATIVEFPESLLINNFRYLFRDIPEDSEFELKAVICFVKKVIKKKVVNHWVTYRRFTGNNTWYLFDDSKVTSVANTAHVYKNPKIVLYERRSVADDRSSENPPEGAKPQDDEPLPPKSGKELPKQGKGQGKGPHNFAKDDIENEKRTSIDDICRRFFGTDLNRWPICSSNQHLRKCALFLLSLSLKWKISNFNASIRVCTLDGKMLTSVNQILEYIDSRKDKQQIKQQFQQQIQMLVRNNKRARGIKENSSSGDDQNGDGGESSFAWDALKLCKDMKSILLRRIDETGKTDVTTITRKAFFADKLISKPVKDKVKRLRHNDDKWYHFNGDSSKDLLKRDERRHILPSEQSRCAPYAFLNIKGLSDHFQRSLFKDVPTNSLNKCSLAELCVLLKKRFNINLKKVHEEVRPDESKKDFMLRQTSGQFLISDASHVIAIDCSTGTVLRGNGIVERFNRSFNFCCEKYAEIRRIEEPDLSQAIQQRSSVVKRGRDSLEKYSLECSSMKIRRIEEPDLSQAIQESTSEVQHGHDSLECSSLLSKTPQLAVMPADRIRSLQSSSSCYCVATLLFLSGQGDSCHRLDCKFIHPASPEEVNEQIFREMLRIKKLKLTILQIEGIQCWMSSAGYIP